MEEDYTETKEWQTHMLLYRIYRHISAILLLISVMITKRSFGSGWRSAYSYEQGKSNGSEFIPD